jgi:hypothetical protein
VDDGFDRLMLALDRDGAGDLPLPGLDEAGLDPTSSGHYVRLILTGAHEQGWPFDEAWSSAINRLQIAGTTVDLDHARALAEDRQLLEEVRPHFHAAYEGRDPTPRERAQSVVSAWGREDHGRNPVSARRSKAA